MKKLTSGIFATLLTVVGVSAANAEIASKAYVDDANTAQTTTLNTAISAKADKATTLAGYGITDAMTTTAINTALDAKANTADLGALADLDTVGTAQIVDKNVTKAKLADDIVTSLGKADSALQAADLSAYQTKEEADAAYDAAGAAATAQAAAIAAAKTAADAAYAVKSTETTATTAATNASAALTNIGTLSTLTTTAKTNAVAAINEVDAAVKENTTALEGKQDTLTTEQLAAANSGITAAKVSTYDGYNATITANTTAAANAQSAAEAAQTTADKAIPAPSTQCTNKGAKCVLTSGEAGYAWEVIARGTAE